MLYKSSFLFNLFVALITLIFVWTGEDFPNESDEDLDGSVNDSTEMEDS